MDHSKQFLQKGSLYRASIYDNANCSPVDRGLRRFLNISVREYARMTEPIDELVDRISDLSEEVRGTGVRADPNIVACTNLASNCGGRAWLAPC